MSTDDEDSEKYHEVIEYCYYTWKYRGAAHSICNLRYKTPKEIIVVFHKVSTYDYYFVIKELLKEFEGQFESLGENTEKYISFSVPIKKQLDNSKTITYKKKGFSIALDLCQPYYQNLLILCLKFIAKNGEIKTSNLSVSLNIVKIKNLLIGAVNVRKKRLKPINELIKKFSNTYKFCNNDINKFILLLKKVLIHMNTWGVGRKI